MIQEFSQHRDFYNIVAIIPAYNEEISIGNIVSLTKQSVDLVIVVDDGSTDKTSYYAKTAGACVISHHCNLGKAAAIMTGISKVRELNVGAVVMLDGDGQHNPSEISSLIKPILEGGSDLVIGSRFLLNGNNIPRYRQIGLKILNIATQVSSGFASSDSQSGFRAISANGLASMNFKSEGYNIESDMIINFMKNKHVISEEPISVNYKVAHKHKDNPLSHGIKIITYLMRITFSERIFSFLVFIKSIFYKN